MPPKVVLAIDTSTRSTRAGCGRFNGTRYEWTHCSESSDRHGTALIPAIEEVCKKETADLIAVAHGPGSFTGLRVGLSAVKALSFVWDVPVLPVSSLSPMGYLSLEHDAEPQELIAFADAGRGEVFFAHYDVRDPNAEEQACGIPIERRLECRGDVNLLSLTEFGKHLEKHPAVLCVGEELKEPLRAPCFLSDFRNTPQSIGEQAVVDYLLGKDDMSDAVEPHYVRGVDAKLPNQ